MFEMTDEEAWDFITQSGNAADPFEVLSNTGVCDPNEVIDFPGDEGVQCIEEVDDFLKRHGHWHESEADLVSHELELSGADYDEYMEAAGPIQKIATSPEETESGDGDETQSADADE